MRKIKSAIVKCAACILVISSVFLTSCKTANEDASGITREDFAGLLGSVFEYENYETTTAFYDDVSSSSKFYNQIQALAEWEVLPSDSSFNPDAKATYQFAVESSVKAIGLEFLAIANSGFDSSNLTDFYVNNIARIEVSNWDKIVDGSTATQIVQYAYDYKMNMELPQYQSIVLAEGVIEDDSVVITSEDSGEFGNAVYSVGDFIYIPGGDTDYDNGIKITSVDGNSFTYENADLSEIFTECIIYGTYDANVIEVEGANATNYSEILGEDDEPEGRFFPGILYDNQGENENTVNCNVDTSCSSNSVTLNANLSGSGVSGTFNASITNIKVTPVYDHGFWIWDAKEAGLKVTFDTSISSSISGSAASTIPLGKITVKLAGPLNCVISLIGNISADGEIDVSYSADNIIDATWKKDKGFNPTMKSDATFTGEADVTIVAEATIKADLRLGWHSLSWSVCNASATTGLCCLANAQVDFLNDSIPDCVDVLIFIPLRYAINDDSCLVTDVCGSAKTSKTVWDSESSPFQWHYHWENGVLVDACTRGDLGEEDVVQDNLDENGLPFDEFNMIDFEVVSFGYIALDSYMMQVEAGSSAEIIVTKLPVGYSESDLITSSENLTVCTTSGLSISGVGPGSCVVVVSTSDNQYNQYISVTVPDTYNEFEVLGE